MDGAKLDCVTIPELSAMYASKKEQEELFATLTPKTIAALKRCWEERLCVLSNEHENETAEVYLPFNVEQRLLQIRPSREYHHFNTDMLHQACTQQLDEFCEFLRVDECGRRLMHSNALLICHARLSLSDTEKLTKIFSTPDDVVRFFAHLKHLYYDALVNAGEAVGLLSSESQGEPLTQLVLDVFHHAGVDQMSTSQGIPRFTELIDVATNIKIPCMSLPLIPTKSNEVLSRLSMILPRRKLISVVAASYVVYQPKINKLVGTENWAKCPLSLVRDMKTFVHVRRLLHGDKQQHRRHQISPYVIVLELDPPFENMKITRDAIISFVGGEQIAASVFIIEESVPAMSSVFLRIRMIGEGCEKMYQALKHDMNVTDDSNDRFCRCVGNMYSFATKELMKKFLKHVYVGLIPGVVSNKTSTNGRSLVTLGSNLPYAWMVPELDWKKCTSNNVREVEQLLGVEAATLTLFHEIRAVLSSGGSFVADRHIALTASIISNCGRMTPLTRHGGSRLGRLPGVISTSFEQQSSHICDSAMFSEASDVSGLADSLVVGKVPKIGTGIVTLINVITANGNNHDSQASNFDSTMFIRSCGTQDGLESKRKIRLEYEKIMGMIKPKDEWKLSHSRSIENYQLKLAPMKTVEVATAHKRQRPSSPVLLRPRTLPATAPVSPATSIDGWPVFESTPPPVNDDVELYDCHGAVNIEVLLKLVKRII